MIKDISKFYSPTLFQCSNWADTPQRPKKPQASGEEGSAPFRNSLILSNPPVGNARRLYLTTFDSTSLIIRINLPLKSNAENSAVNMYVSLIPPEKHEARNTDPVIRPGRTYFQSNNWIEKISSASYNSAGDSKLGSRLASKAEVMISKSTQNSWEL